MSHVSTVKVEIKDLEAVKLAAKELGGVFMEGQKTYNWFGRFVGDAPLPPGMTQEMLGKCEHAIRVPGVRYEVGVVRLADGSYTFAYDSWGYDGKSGDGLQKAFGPNCERLVQAYSVHKTRRVLEPHGFRLVEAASKNGNRHFQMTRAW